MVRLCCVCGELQVKEDENRSFHVFPTLESRRNLWLQAIKKGEEDVPKSAVICSDHFTKEDFSDMQGPVVTRRQIKRNAVPSCNLTTDRQQETCAGVDVEKCCVEEISVKKANEENIPQTTKRKAECILESNCYQSPKKKIRLAIGSGSECFSESDFKSKLKWNAFNKFIKSSRSKYKNLRRTSNRRKKKVHDLKELLRDLKKNHYLSDKGADCLKALPQGVQLLITAVLQGKKYRKFPLELRNFAMTLHFYSPNGYNYVRKSFMKFLPHPATMHEWLKTINYNPGISSEAIESVKMLVKEADKRGKKLYFNITVDEMSIRKHVSWNKFEQKFEGLIDMGLDDNDDYDNSPAATNAIVFMLVCINGHFKIPIAYYLINALSGSEKNTLMSNILKECFSSNIDVRHITFDGSSSNISMAEQLGADIYCNTEAAFFKRSVDNKAIYTSLDGCHMLKLVRNTLASTNLTDENENQISWKYLEALVAHQEKEGLHAATKIRKRHVQFTNEKMKVNLAAQALSSSVAAALNSCEFDHELEEFEGSSATATFCKVMNDAFDLLNSRNKFCKSPTKHAISTDNLEEVKVKVDAYVHYIKKLKINGQNILQTNKRTGFLGLIIALKNVVQLAQDLFKEGYMTFLLTYKLSQDHLETYFACVRRFGGLNNNPTSMQFKSAHRKLLSHVNISVPLSANCTAKDDTLLLQKTDDKASNDIQAHAATNNIDLLIDSVELENICSSIPQINLSEYINDIIAYISGAVVKNVIKKVKCHLCIKCLQKENNEEVTSVLQRRKAYGTLISASKDVISITTTAEKVFRSYRNTLKQKNILQKMILTTIYLLPVNSLFTENEHVFEQEPLSDHRNQLLKLLLHQYFQIRLFHEASSLEEFQTRIRTRNNKLTLFSNQ